MPSTFRPYTQEELTRAAESYGLDPAFVQAVYSVESSNGTDPNAMRARSVQRKRDRTIVRGPFQLEDGTVSDIVRKAKLGPVNVDDPDTHLDLAMRIMSDLRDRYDGDYRKMAQAYLGGAGGVANTKAKDELGTTTESYGNRILAEMNRISGDQGERMASLPAGLDLAAPGPRTAPDTSNPLMELSPYMHGADAGGDMFGMSDDMLAMPAASPDSWHALVAANRSSPSTVGLGIPDELGALPDRLPNADTADIDQYLSRLVSEEMDGRDYASA